MNSPFHKARNITPKVALVLVLSFILLPSTGQDIDSASNSQLSWRVFPAFGAQPETGFVFGVVMAATWSQADTAAQEFDRPSSLTPLAIYSVRNQVLVEFNFDYFLTNGTNLNFTPRFSLFPDRFFGVGNDNDPDAYETYTNRIWQLEGQFSVPYTNKLFWGVYTDIQHSKLKELELNGELETGTILGSEGGFQAGLGPALRYDSRDNAIYPSKGYFLNVRSLFSFLGDFSYSNYLLDFRRYFSLREDKDVLALQFNASFTSGRDIPFYKLPQLGGSSRLRGINNANVYRDRQLLFSQVEYRKHLFWAFGIVAFAGVGDVADEMSQFQLSDFKYVGGAGIRYQVLEGQKLNLRFDYGFARGGQSAFYISLREAF